MAHFRATLGLCFKTSPRGKPFVGKYKFDVNENNPEGRTHFHKKGFDIEPKGQSEMAY